MDQFIWQQRGHVSVTQAVPNPKYFFMLGIQSIDWDFWILVTNRKGHFFTDFEKRMFLVRLQVFLDAQNVSCLSGAPQ